MKRLIYILSIGAITLNVSAQTKKIGINTDANLKAEVDVNGGVSIEKTPETDDQTLPLLGINNETKRLVKYNPPKAIRILVMKIKTTTGQDWIYDFNTKIPTNKYYLVLSNAYFGNKAWDNDTNHFPSNIVYGMSHVYKNSDNGRHGKVYNMTSKISLTQKEDEWHLAADYPSSNAYCKNLSNDNTCNDDFYWYITTIAFDKKYVGELGTYTSDGQENSVNILQNLLEKKISASN